MGHTQKGDSRRKSSSPVFLPLPPHLRSRHLRRVAPTQEKGSGDQGSSSLQLRQTLPAQQGLLWVQNLRRPLKPVSVARRHSNLRRLEFLRGGGGGRTRGGNVQLLSRSRPRWEREWKVTGASSPSWAGSTRTETRRTRQLLLI